MSLVLTLKTPRVFIAKANFFTEAPAVIYDNQTARGTKLNYFD